MRESRSILRDLTSEIADTERPLWSLGAEITALFDFLKERTAFRFNPGSDIAAGETRTDSGLAISPIQAAMCAWEVARTAAFIRGLKQAVQDASDSLSGRPLHVLYAGCGPYALLAVPLMSLFPPDRIQFVLLDIHQTSIASARSVVESLEFTEHITDYVCGDACHFDTTTHPEPDIIVSETMNVCLANEPLVMIACRLLSQSAAAIMVPASVHVDACLVDESKEFTLVDPNDVGDYPVPNRDRVMLGKVFELNGENARRWGSSLGDRLPASRVVIPSPLEARYRAMLLTTVVVYGDIELRDYDCSLTIPRPITTSQPLSGGEALQFEYRLGTKPGLAWNVAADG